MGILSWLFDRNPTKESPTDDSSDEEVFEHPTLDDWLNEEASIRGFGEGISLTALFCGSSWPPHR